MLGLTKPGRVRRSEHERGWAPMSETTTQILEPVFDERSKVESWRLHILIEAGYPLPLAERLAVSEADLHVACEMLGRGCTPETAAEILL
jgi:hypothetical protein